MAQNKETVLVTGAGSGICNKLAKLFTLYSWQFQQER
jgi:NADP-dependent 3-hydroxy acid dehydrogenase YdfG